MAKKNVHLPEEMVKAISEAAAQAGAKAFYETMQREHQQERETYHDRRLRNTRLLLTNYRAFKAHAENAVYKVQEAEDDYDITELMSDRYADGDAFVESIKNSVARTVTIVKHVTTMLGLYEVYCNSTGNPEDVRRWSVINGLYVAEQVKTPKQLASELYVTERTVYRDVSDAINALSALIFGVDGVKKE